MKHATYGSLVGDLLGDQAVFKVLRWTGGNFELNFEGKTDQETTKLNTQGLLMEGLRLLDESQRDGPARKLSAESSGADAGVAPASDNAVVSAGPSTSPSATTRQARGRGRRCPPRQLSLDLLRRIPHPLPPRWLRSAIPAHAGSAPISPARRWPKY